MLFLCNVVHFADRCLLVGMAILVTQIVVHYGYSMYVIFVNYCKTLKFCSCMFTLCGTKCVVSASELFVLRTDKQQPMWWVVRSTSLTHQSVYNCMCKAQNLIYNTMFTIYHSLPSIQSTT